MRHLIERIEDAMTPGKPVAVVEARKTPTSGKSEDVTKWISNIGVADLKAESDTLIANYIRGTLEEWAGELANDIENLTIENFDTDEESAQRAMDAISSSAGKSTIKAKAVEILKIHLGNLLQGKITVGYPFK